MSSINVNIKSWSTLLGTAVHLFIHAVVQSANHLALAEEDAGQEL